MNPRRFPLGHADVKFSKYAHLAQRFPFDCLCHEEVQYEA
jgi:hypothetical protein